jgi:hypothetical protein
MNPLAGRCGFGYDVDDVRKQLNPDFSKPQRTQRTQRI